MTNLTVGPHSIGVEVGQRLTIILSSCDFERWAQEINFINFLMIEKTRKIVEISLQRGKIFYLNRKGGNIGKKEDLLRHREGNID